MQISRALIQSIAVDLLHEPDSPLKADEVDLVSNKTLSSHITLKWVDAFLSRCNIVIRKQFGSLIRSPTQTRFIERNVAYYLGQVQRRFDLSDLDENMVENKDETHFIFNMDNHKTLGFRGIGKVKIANVVSVGDGFTMVLRLCGGVDAKLEDSFLIFKNRSPNYPLVNVPDDIPRVTYRTQKRGWMDNITFQQWLQEPRAICKD